MSLLTLFVPTDSSITLSIQDILHTQGVDNIVLTQIHQLTAQDATHSHSVDNAVLTQVHNLTVSDSLHTHSADNITLLIPATLIVQDILHGGVTANQIFINGRLVTKTSGNNYIFV